MGIFSEVMEKSGNLKDTMESKDPFISIASVQQYLLGAFLDEAGSLEKFPRLIGITSGQKGEGVSTISRMLSYALCYSEEKPVYLIDANVDSPSIHVSENLPLEPGFSDVLNRSGHDNIESLAHPKDPLPLRIVTAGKMVKNPSILSACSVMDGFFDKLRSVSSYVIFDLPPIHSHPEVVIFSKKLDGIIFVIRAHHTSIKSAAVAVDKIKRSGIPIIGGLLNRKRYFIPKWLYERL